MDTVDLAGIVARDADCGTLLPPSSEWPEYQTMADRRALLALVREARSALVHVWEADIDDGFIVSDNFDATDSVQIEVHSVLARTAALNPKEPS